MRAITEESGCEIWSLPEDNDVYWDGSSTKRLVIQPQWLQLYKELIGGPHTHVLLEGKAGRGKSVYLRYMIIRMLEDPTISSEATFAYTEKNGTDRCSFWIKKDGVSVDVIDVIPDRPTYLLMDNVDSNLIVSGKKLNLGLTSGDIEVMKDFKKRRIEAARIDRGMTYTMQALDLNVMALMFPHLLLDERQFRFDVLGGNPRMFLYLEYSSLSTEIKKSIYPELQRCLYIFFGQAYNHEQSTPEGKRALWIMSVIAKEVERGAECDSSLFRADFALEDSKSETRFATTFLRLVAGALDSKNDASLLSALTRIRGVGYAHEYLSHTAFLAGSPNTTTFGLSPTRVVAALPAGLYGRQVTLVRNIPDLKNMESSTYGLPTISNFPAVDAVLSTTLLQMTISNKHGGAMDKLPNIAEALGVEVKDLLLVFVVESVKTAWAFQFPLLPDIRMVVIPREVCTEQALLTGH